MDLRRRLTRWALARPHVLVVDVPGSRTLRWELEEEVDRRRWPVAASPADTDVLLVVGDPGPELSAAVEVLWSQVPHPRHRQDVPDRDGVAARLDEAASSLRALTADADERADPLALLTVEPAHDEHDGHEGHEGHEGHDGHEGHEGHDGHGGSGDDSESGEHDHHMHHGGEVAGLPMAGTAPDRDGLELDSLHVSLGPVLPGWPTGLVLSASLQGDVLTGVQVSWLDADHTPSTGHDGSTSPGHDLRPEIKALDSLARFLVVAGWPLAARRTRGARHGLLSADDSRVRRGRAEAARLARGVRRSPFLRWSVRRIGVVPDESRTSAGDVLDRVYRWCDLADGTASVPASPAIDPESLADLLEGQELASARLIVASVDVERVNAPTRHGSAHA